jgi:ADP-ribose pyrophosphatase YjhB (NUDIX family)
MTKIVKSAGLCIIKDKKILLCHPTNAKYYHTYSIPKGIIEDNEDKIDAAIRETFEEIGILIDKYKINFTEYCIPYINNQGEIYKKIYYYIVELKNDDIPLVIPDKNFKPNKDGIIEVDWAGFLDIEEAEKRIFYKLTTILNHIK